MKLKKFHITLLFVFIWSFSFAQQFTNYSTKEGLPSNHVYKVIQDAKGFIWIATDKGLVKYNGSDFKTFTTKDGLATNDIWGLNATPDGKIWYQSKAFKVGYIENDSVYAFESEIKGEIFNSLFTNQINNEIILTSGNKTHTLVNNKWKTILENKNREYKNYIKHKYVSSIIISKNRDSILVLDKKNDILKNINSYDFSTIQNKRGQLTDSLFFWINDDNYKILNLNTLKLTEQKLIDEINLKSTQHTRINLINNRLQISGRGFVGFLDDEFHIKNAYYFPKDLDAHFGFIDASQNIWLCTFSNGLYKLPRVKRNVKYILNNQKVNYLDLINDKIIATVYNKGFYEYNNATKNFNKLIDKPQFLFQPFFIKELNTTFYLSKFNMTSIKNGKQKDIVLINGFINHTNEAARKLVYYNNYLYGTFGVGFSKINPKTYHVLEEFIQQGLNSIFVFKNKFLIATTNGLKEFKNNKIENIVFENYQLDKSILNIHKISETQILLNTDGFGAYISDFKTIKQLPKSEFLIVNNAFVEKNSIWLATNKGIIKYIKSNGNYIYQKITNNCQGLPSNDVNDILIHENNIFASTNLGVAILPVNQEVNQQFLDIYINKAYYNTFAITENSTFYYQENNSANFEISKIDYSENTNNFFYQYKLEPIQKQWIKTSSKNISFNALSPDNYKLIIKTNGIVKTLNFTIKPLWWQEIWFKIAAFILFLCLLVWLVWYLIKFKTKKENERIVQEQKFSELQLKALRSQMNPHFVFNSLSSIQYYINENDYKTSEFYLVKFSKLIRQFFEISKENKIAIKNEIDLLTNYLDIEKLRFKDKLDYTINADELLLEKEIPSMLLQPIVENAINHGVFNKDEKGNIIINFSMENEIIRIEIIDDGVGFEKTKKINNKMKSSQVSKDRIYFLNTSKSWEIVYFKEIPYPNFKYVGNKSVFLIKKL